MFVKGLALLLVTLAFQNFGAHAELPSLNDAIKDAECIAPRILNSLPFLNYSDTTTCPGLFDSGDKKYCCINLDFKVKCCDLTEYAIFGLVCLSPIISILISVCCCCCCCFCKKLVPCC